MQTRQLYATGTATAASAATLQVPGRGRLVMVQWNIAVTSITASVVIAFELTTIPAAQAATNDARNLISVVRFNGNFVTSGLSQGGINVVIPSALPVAPGDLLYLHVSQSGTATWAGGAILWFDP